MTQVPDGASTPEIPANTIPVPVWPSQWITSDHIAPSGLLFPSHSVFIKFHIQPQFLNRVLRSQWEDYLFTRLAADLDLPGRGGCRHSILRWRRDSIIYELGHTTLTIRDCQRICKFLTGIGLKTRSLDDPESTVARRFLYTVVPWTQGKLPPTRAESERVMQQAREGHALFCTLPSLAPRPERLSMMDR